MFDLSQINSCVNEHQKTSTQDEGKGAISYITNAPGAMSTSALKNTLNTHKECLFSSSQTSINQSACSFPSADPLPVFLEQQANLITDSSTHFDGVLSGGILDSNGAQGSDSANSSKDIDIVMDDQISIEIESIFREMSSWYPAYLSNIDDFYKYQLWLSTGSGRCFLNHDLKARDSSYLSEKQTGEQLEAADSPSDSVSSIGPRITTKISSTAKSSVNTTGNGKTIRDPDEVFKKYAPLIPKVTPQNFARFLVQCLKDYHHHIPLEGLFDILYGEVYSNTHSETKEKDKSRFSEVERKGLRFCSIILDIFKDSQSSKGLRSSLIRNSSLSCVNLHEFLRTFLAIKILFTCLKPARDPLMAEFNVPKSYIYKMYSIVCQKYSHKHRSISIPAAENIVLGKSKIGQLMNLIHPNLVSKRLGRRGVSKFYYIGVEWNDALVDTDMHQLLELEIPQINNHFKNLSATIQPKVQPRVPGKHISPTNSTMSKPPQPGPSGNVVFEWLKPTRSFIEMSFKYPFWDCSPRVWKATPNQIPRQAQWAEQKMQRSLEFLSVYKINMGNLIEIVQSGNFTRDTQNILSNTISDSIKTLQNASAKKEAYKHLVLAVLLLVFPVVVASDEEVPFPSKTHFRRSLARGLQEVELSISNTTDEVSLSTFVEILKKMVILIDMTSHKVPPEYAETILNEKVYKLALTQRGETHGSTTKSPLEKMFFNSIVLSFNALNFTIIDGCCQAGDTAVHETISMLSNFLAKKLISAKEDMRNLLLQGSSGGSDKVCQDISYQVFKIVIELFHEALVNPLVGKLPIPVFKFILRTTSELLQSGNAEVKAHEEDFSKESFQCSWVTFNMFQEYLNIMSEVVALSEILNQNTLQ
ncbi:hypothetical protein JCM33374_g4408 [Metschnikowia sp. JCM 33374]|nr:hypothetical protein JCM33374_g4408 [Metschnikowia sp. JCM 33374]